MVSRLALGAQYAWHTQTYNYAVIDVLVVRQDNKNNFQKYLQVAVAANFAATVTQS